MVNLSDLAPAPASAQLLMSHIILLYITATISAVLKLFASSDIPQTYHLTFIFFHCHYCSEILVLLPPERSIVVTTLGLFCFLELVHFQLGILLLTQKDIKLHYDNLLLMVLIMKSGILCECSFIYFEWS